jgi:hypothetical protein
MSPLVRRYGVRGAKLFARLWFSALYVALVALTGASWAVAPEAIMGSRRILIGSLVGGLVDLATSLLTRMRLEYLAAIKQLETPGESA